MTVLDPARWSRAQVDDRIAKWNHDLQIATKNILELMDDLQYKSLVGDGGLGIAPLTGRTEREVTPALAALDELWQILPALSKVIDEANDRYKKLPWFRDTEPLYEIQQLLEGDSIQITTKTDYAQRGLLTPDEVTRTLRPERVLTAMVEAYGRAKAVVVTVADVLHRLGPELDRATRELAAIAIELPASPEIGALEARLAELRGQLASDPLGLADTFDRDVDPAIAGLRRRLDEARVERERVDGELATADQRIAELAGARDDALAAHAECRDKVVVERAPREPFAPAVVDELRHWLERLRKTQHAGKWQATRIGLANWSVQVTTRIAECAAVAAENRRPLDRRNELRGLLDGLKAKASNTGLAEDPVVTELYRKAHAVLYARPTALAEAERLVADYLRAVR
jgi:hypothetical protein